MKKPLLLVCALALSAVSASAAQAAVCVSLDQARDNLTEQERSATVAMLQQTLRDQGQEVSNQNCMDTYFVYHLRLGASVTVYMQAQRGYRSSTARAIEELPAVYSQMVRSIISGQPMNATANGVVDRTNVTSAQQAPARVDADTLWYVRLGYGGVAGPAFISGPAIGFGYRYELDNIAVDVSFFNLMISSDQGHTDANGVTTGGSAGVSGSWAKLAVLWFKDPLSNSSIYFGAGLSWGGAAVATADSTLSAYSGSGLQGEASAGYEFLRASTIRLFIQADATLPFYTVSRVGLNGTEKGYAPMFTVGVGIGWGRSALRVRVI